MACRMIGFYITVPIMSYNQYSGVSHLFPPAVYLLPPARQPSARLTRKKAKLLPQPELPCKKIARLIWTIACHIYELVLVLIHYVSYL